jgi:hypothetical protein
MSDYRIFRYQLPVNDIVNVWMPVGAQALSVAPTRDGSNEIDLWALVDTDNESDYKTFLVFGTGNPVDLPEYAQFVGTVALLGGSFIGHVFEVTS